MYLRYLKLNLDKKQSAFFWGARKVGKSTFLKQHYPASVYYDLLKTDLYIKYTKEPYLLRQEIEMLETNKPIIIDEIQKISALLNEIHWLIENTDNSFILCGSSSRKLKLHGVNLLGGRALKYKFYPLVYPEFKQDFDLLRIFNNGLVPSHFLSNNPHKLLKSYIEDYLTHEIQSEGLVRNLSAFSRFLDSTAFSCGEMLNYSNVARECGIDAKTVKEYYQILVDTLVGYLIDPYSKKIKRDIISATPKFYYFDVGVANRIQNKTINELKGAEAGKSLEHYILMELIAYINLNDLDYKINYWRTKTGLEVDFIVTQNAAAPIPIEVKISNKVHSTELKGIKAFITEYDVENGYVVSLEPTARKITVGSKKYNYYQLNNFYKNYGAVRFFKTNVKQLFFGRFFCIVSLN